MYKLSEQFGTYLRFRSQIFDRPRGPSGLTPRQRARTEATKPALKNEEGRSRTMSELAPSRTKPETLRLRTTSEVPPPIGFEAPNKRTKPEVVRQVTKPEVPRQEMRVIDPPPSKFLFPAGIDLKY